MIDETKLLKIELLRQKNLKRIDTHRKRREFQPERFDEVQFAKCIGFDKALQCVMHILEYKSSDIMKGLEE